MLRTPIFLRLLLTLPFLFENVLIPWIPICFLPEQILLSHHFPCKLCWFSDCHYLLRLNSHNKSSRYRNRMINYAVYSNFLKELLSPIKKQQSSHALTTRHGTSCRASVSARFSFWQIWTTIHSFILCWRLFSCPWVLKHLTDVCIYTEIALSILSSRLLLFQMEKGQRAEGRWKPHNIFHWLQNSLLEYQLRCYKKQNIIKALTSIVTHLQQPHQK